MAHPSEGDLGSTPSDSEDEECGYLHHGGTSQNSIRRSGFILDHGSSAALKDVYETDEKPLDKGGFGVVYRARLLGHGGQWTFAVKTVMKKHAKASEQSRHEASIMKGLDHPHVCRIFETFEEPKCFHIVLELIEGQNMFDYVFSFAVKGESLEELVAADLTYQILEGLHYCHLQEIIHGDIKPENIMINFAPERTKPCVKIIDFGLATPIVTATGSACGGFRGTYAYASPEVKKGKGVNAASDLWSTGMVVHVLLLGGLPGDRVRDGKIPLQVSHEAYAALSEQAREFLHGLLQIEPRKRLSAAQLEMTSSDSWTSVARVSVNSSSVPVHVSTASLESFTRFHRSSLLHKAVITAMAVQLLSNKENIDIENEFVAMDYDGNGCVSKEELCKAVAERAPETASADIMLWIELIFASIDTDGSGEIEYTEYRAAVLNQGLCQSDEAIQAAFRVFDVDQSGKVSSQEFSRVMHMMPTDIVECMVEFDADGDGEIDLHEFKNIVAGSFVPLQQPSPPARDSLMLVSSVHGRRCFKL